MRRYVRIRTYVNTYVRAYATWLITFGHLRLRAYVRTYVPQSAEATADQWLVTPDVTCLSRPLHAYVTCHA